MKSQSEKYLGVKVFCLTLFLVLLFSFMFFVQQQQVSPRPAQIAVQHFDGKNDSAQQLLPVRLIIPSIGVDAQIESVGVTPNGAMDVPKDAENVGWFELGSQPGEKGSAVIAGHFDGKNGKTGVFSQLSKLEKGDTLFVENSQGQSVAFIVQESSSIDPGYADDVFGRYDGAHLNLITCDGIWDTVKKSYSKRRVVFADLLE